MQYMIGIRQWLCSQFEGLSGFLNKWETSEEKSSQHDPTALGRSFACLLIYILALLFARRTQIVTIK